MPPINNNSPIDWNAINVTPPKKKGAAAPPAATNQLPMQGMNPTNDQYQHIDWNAMNVAPVADARVIPPKKPAQQYAPPLNYPRNNTPVQGSGGGGPTGGTGGGTGGANPVLSQSPTGVSDASFLGLLNGLNSGFQTNNALVDQKNAVMNAMMGNPVDPQKMSQLPPDIQDILKRGNKDELLLQAQVLNDAINGKNSSIASSIQYLTSGYQNAQAQYQTNLTNVLNYSKALNSKPSDIIKALYPSIYANMPKDQLASLDALQAPLMTTTQVPSMTTGSVSSSDVSSGNFTVTGGLAGSSAAYNNFFGIKDPTTGNLAHYATQQEGVQAGMQLMQAYQNGDITVPIPDGPNAGQTLGPSSTLEDMARVYAPTSDNNDPKNVAKTWGATLGVDPTTPISQVDTTQLGAAVMNEETGAKLGSNPLTNPQVVAFATDVSNGTYSSISGVPKAFQPAVAMYMAQNNIPSPLGDRRWLLAAQAAVKNYIDLPEYSLTANAFPYIQKIDAAIKIPGSVSDQDLADSYTKLSTQGGVISDAQVKVITDGMSFSDSANVFGKKLAEGGVLSDNQRQQIYDVSHAVYDNLINGYQPIYDQAKKNLVTAGIPNQFQDAVLPDLKSLSALSLAAENKGGTSGGSSSSSTSGGSYQDYLSAIGN